MSREPVIGDRRCTQSTLMSRIKRRANAAALQNRPYEAILRQMIGDCHGWGPDDATNSEWQPRLRLRCLRSPCWPCGPPPPRSSSRSTRRSSACSSWWTASTATPGRYRPASAARRAATFRPQILSRNHRSTIFSNAPMPYAIFYSGHYAIHGTTAVVAARHARLEGLRAAASVQCGGAVRAGAAARHGQHPHPDPGFDARRARASASRDALR